MEKQNIDFTNCKQLKKSYGGANGSKKCIVYKNEIYMLKFPKSSERNENLSYLNNVIGEYIGSHIFETFNIPVQETLLGTFTTEDSKEKIVVACKDFTELKYDLQNFASEKNKIINSKSEGKGTELSSIMEAIEKNTDIDPVETTKRFWDVFIVDALIANWDRHNENWGFLYDKEKDTLRLAPVYDCASSLYPSADEQTMKNIMNNENELKVRIYERPTSAIQINDQRINYFDFINSLENKDCNNALKRIYQKFNKDKIFNVIENTPFINNYQKDFYKYMITKREEMILRPAYSKILLRENNEEYKKQKGVDYGRE